MDRKSNSFSSKISVFVFLSCVSFGINSIANAKTQFENAKTQFENVKTQFETVKTQITGDPLAWTGRAMRSKKPLVMLKTGSKV